MKRVYRDNNASVHRSAARNGERFLFRWRTGRFVSLSIYIEFRLFMLPKRRSEHLISMSWIARDTVSPGRTDSLASVLTRPALSRRPAVRPRNDSLVVCSSFEFDRSFYIEFRLFVLPNRFETQTGADYKSRVNCTFYSPFSWKYFLHVLERFTWTTNPFTSVMDIKSSRSQIRHINDETMRDKIYRKLYDGRLSIFDFLIFFIWRSSFDLIFRDPET